MPALEALQRTLGELTGAELYKKIVERVGKEPGLELGHGMKGVVYGLGDGRVLKITADASEIQAMTIVKSASHPNLVRVDDVFVVCRGQSGVGVVVREWVGNVLENIEEMDYVNSLIRIAVDDVDDEIRDVYRKEYSDREASHLGMQDLVDRLEDVGDSDAARKIVRGLRAGIQKLLNLGIYGIDFEPRNTAVDDNGNPVIFDVGVVSLAAPAQVERIDCPVGRKIVSP
jgi:hypothetical protein